MQITLPAASWKKQTLTSRLAEQAGTKMGNGKIPAKYQCHTQVDEVAAEEVENREENSVGDDASYSLPKVYLYTLWSTCVHNPLRGD